MFRTTVTSMTGIRQAVLAAWFVVAWVPASTVQANESPTPEGVEFFEKHVRPLLLKSCHQCHSSQTDARQGGLALDSRKGWIQGGDNGPAILPGNVDGSLLIQAIRSGNPERRMPPEKPLTVEEIAVLEQWVRMGAPDPRETPWAGNHAAHPSDPILGRDHWAFRPLRNDGLPNVQGSDWPTSDMDRFILSRLEAADLRPAPDADRRTLVRRLFIQLTGLPPTPDQVQEFLADDRPDATARLVDRLLESHHFGERWGRHWLDLARYSDSNGLDENFLFREAWRYRNWVISAVNADMPFDRFLTEQIAGDLLPYDSIEQRDSRRIAAGFLLLGPKVLLGSDPNKQRMDIADEQLDTIGKAILGQTLGCARCHDHKFDPIPTADYYALAGILTSTKVMEQRYMLNEQRVMERLVGLGADGETLDDEYEKYWRDRPRLNDRLGHAKTALDLIEKEDTDGFRTHAEKHGKAVAEGAADPNLPKEQRIAAQKQLVSELESRINSPPPIPARAMIPSDADSPADERIRIAGQFDKPGDVVPRGFLQVLGESDIAIPSSQSGRLELSRWLTDVDQGAGRLTARVLANRIWHHLMGRGIVRTVDNFGRTGEAPSHPELLDHLARKLIDSGWSLKSLVREIVLSRTFAMSSRHDPTGYDKDPENILLWRAHRRRLDPESLRDGMLAAAGTLDPTPMDSTVWYLGDQATAVGANTNRRRTDFSCRSVYLPVIRNDLPEVFDVFDFTDPQMTTGLRRQTIVPTQGLFALNDVSVMDAATATARRLLTTYGPENPDRRVDGMYELIVNGRPDPAERSEMLAFVADVRQRFADQPDGEADLRAWAMSCQILFASSRFQILE